MSTKSETASDSPNIKYEEEIADELGITIKELHSVVLSQAFLSPWTVFRDILPLQPNVQVSISPKGRRSRDKMITKIYTMMDSLAASPYDRPTSTTRSTWTPQDHLECLIYQVTKNLACESQILASVFDRKSLHDEAGRKNARKRIYGVGWLTVYMIHLYWSSEVSKMVRKIEEMHPAANPEWSPLPEVRMRYQLGNKSMDELMEMAWGQAENKKEWLIERIVEQSRLVGAKSNGAEAEAQKKSAVSQKRGAGEMEDEENGKVNSKRPRAVLG